MPQGLGWMGPYSAASQRRPSYLGVIEPAVAFLAKRVELRLIEYSIQLLIKRMARRLGPLARVKQVFLLLPSSLRSHRHT